MHSTTKRTAGLLACLSILGLLSLLVADSAVAATASDLAKVTVGMARTEVQKIMGAPSRNQAVSNRPGVCRLYGYRGVGTYRTVNIWFDCSDKVKSIDKIK